MSPSGLGHSWRVLWIAPLETAAHVPGTESFVGPHPTLSGDLCVLFEATPDGIDLVATSGPLDRLTLPWRQIVSIDFLKGSYSVA